MLFDEKRKNIVITIRGTASMMDAINDLSLDDEAFSVDIGTDPILHRDKNLPDEVCNVLHIDNCITFFLTVYLMTSFRM